MKTYRITKYNPKNRDKDDIYLNNEWTSISDIGSYYSNYKLTAFDYLKVENQYLQVFELFLENIELNLVILNDLEKYFYKINDDTDKELYNDNLEYLFNELSNNYPFNTKDEILNTIRLILREHIWGKFSIKNSNLRFEFGNDFYSYLISNKLPIEIINYINRIGLFIEEI